MNWIQFIQRHFFNNILRDFVSTSNIRLDSHKTNPRDRFVSLLVYDLELKSKEGSETHIPRGREEV